MPKGLFDIEPKLDPDQLFWITFSCPHGGGHNFTKAVKRADLTKTRFAMCPKHDYSSPRDRSVEATPVSST